jgi:hypothetical protein
MPPWVTYTLLAGCVALFVFGLSALHPADAGAVSKRKQCREACGAKIDDCIA